MHDRKTSLMAADLLNDRGLAFFGQQEIVLNRIPVDLGAPGEVF
jgi:hypothetical protein